jgi:hypothetical protein
MCLSPGLARAQGSIFGTVTASGGATPDSGSLMFFGYIDNTDKEIRIETADGAGYDAGNWYDDFQNYLGEAAGLPYAYHFYDTSRGEGYILSDVIPSNSFQQENITLAPVDWPARPTYLTGRAVDPGHVELRWLYLPTLTYHIYRRVQPSNGSFFRIDDTTGSLDNPGIADGIFVDDAVDSGVVYDYLLISENTSGQMGTHSDIFSVEANEGTFLLGDPNHDGRINVGDITFLTNYIFKGGASPDPLESGETNCDGNINIGDVVLIVSYLFRIGPPPICP